MTWTGRPDDEPCCGDVPGAVAPQEAVARLIHSKIEVPAHSAFKRSELTCPDPGVEFDNACGNADGCSVDRSLSLTDPELCQRADTQAALREGRTGRGAYVAEVAALRAIIQPAQPAQRAVFVYDDPKPGNTQHAVIRIAEKVPRADFEHIRSLIMKAFARRVLPPTSAETAGE
jgi:hypothetical protein